MLNQVLKVSSRKHVNVDVNLYSASLQKVPLMCSNSLLGMLSKSVTFLDFQLSQGNVGTYCRWGENLCDVYI